MLMSLLLLFVIKEPQKLPLPFSHTNQIHIILLTLLINPSDRFFHRTMLSTSLFQVTEHTFSCQYIREYPHAQKFDWRTSEAHNQGVPAAKKCYLYSKTQTESRYGWCQSIIITRDLKSVRNAPTSSSQIWKDTCESLWVDLYKQLGNKLRTMWIADSSHQGASGCLINIFRTMIVGDAPRVENSVIDHLIRT